MKSLHCFVLPAFFLYVSFTWCSCEAADGEEERLAFFENKIRPVLVESCYGCHSAEASSPKGGLLLDTREAAQKGGDSGAAVVPNEPDESLLLSALRYEDYEMPPKGQLPEAVIADFETWIRMGAADPREGAPAVTREIDMDAGREFWAFQLPGYSDVPRVENEAWPLHDIDRFVLSRLEERDLTPSPDASAEMWLRRVSFDLTGLPPTEQQLEEFLADESSEAKSRVVDSLLASRHFGERWGRHWLDVARYAESTGRTRNYPFPFAWRYRDYVIAAFNADKPIDQFIVEQIAGDLLSSDTPAERESQLVATGFLAMGPPDLNERDARAFQMDMVADQIDTLGRSLLGLTVGCARCHDHKFDPIPTADYYALAGIFKSTQLLNGYEPRGGGGNKARGDLLIKLGDAEDQPAPELSEEERLTLGLNKKQAKQLLNAKATVDAIEEEIREVRRDKELPKAERDRKLSKARQNLTKKKRQFNQLQNRLSRNRKIKFEGPACMGVRDAQAIADCPIHIRGDTRRLGDVVPRGFLQVASRSGANSVASSQSGRLELAKWIANAENPLTARVFVNRVWKHLFGTGIVRTVDNFGEMGARPSHPELLDYLAVRFMETGWSTKWLVRELVLSRTYGQDVSYSPEHAAEDQDNTLLWRMNARRLDYESIRDSMLLVSGQLEASPPTGSYVQTVNVAELSRRRSPFDYQAARYRSVYLPVLRNLLPQEMSYFDFPDASETRGDRNVTTVPTQSLYLLNGDFVRTLARDAAGLLLSDQDDRKVARRAYRRLFGRDATEEEMETIWNYVEQRRAEFAKDGVSDRVQRAKTKRPNHADPRVQAWTEVIQAMFASAEFRYH